jgi:hypothetical protein
LTEEQKGYADKIARIRNGWRNFCLMIGDRRRGR